DQGQRGRRAAGRRARPARRPRLLQPAGRARPRRAVPPSRAGRGRSLRRALAARARGLPPGRRGQDDEGDRPRARDQRQDRRQPPLPADGEAGRPQRRRAGALRRPPRPVALSRRPAPLEAAFHRLAISAGDFSIPTEGFPSAARQGCSPGRMGASPPAPTHSEPIAWRAEEAPPMTYRALPIALAALSLATLPGRAATPAAGTVSETQPTVTWQGDLKPPLAVVGCSSPSDANCDNFQLTVTPPSYPFVVQITLHLAAANDWDLKVYDAAGQVVATSGNGPGQDEVAVLSSPAAGTYTVQALNFAAVTAVQGVATLAPKPDDAATEGTKQPPTYSVFTDPAEHSSGEPSVGVNWNSEIADNGGTVMYVSGLNTLRLRFDDCTSPARLRPGGDWLDVSPANALTSLDPILFTDSTTGRTFSSQLLGKTSLMSYTDDDGASWIPSQGSGINSGVDHQTIGAGPFAPPLAGPLHPHAVYYCSQDVALAECALSLDGGLTFGPALPIYSLLDCGGIHGHVKVGPDGTAYVPNKSCGGHQGVAVSSNDGLTWTVRAVPGSLPGTWDPTVAIGASGTVYFAFGNADG